MELSYLRYFYEVAKAGSFTEAARRLHISQSALSKAVALLEDAEGVQLLERSKHGVELTAIGEQVFVRSESIFETVSDIKTVCKGIQRTPEGRLAIGSSDHVANYFLVKKIRQMRELYPQMTFSLQTGAPVETIDLILKKQIEFGLFFSKIEDPSLEYESLLSVDMAIVCTPALLQGARPSASSARLKTLLRECGLIGSIKAQYRNHPSKTLIDLMGKDPHIIFESNSQEAQKRLCLEGDGVAFLARFMVADELKDGTLVEIPVAKPTTFHLWLATKKRAFAFAKRPNILTIN